MSDTTYLFNNDIELDIEVTNFEPKVEGRLYGAPEDCYEGEPAEVDFEASSNGVKVNTDEIYVTQRGVVKSLTQVISDEIIEDDGDGYGSNYLKSNPTPVLSAESGLAYNLHGISLIIDMDRDELPDNKGDFEDFRVMFGGEEIDSDEIFVYVDKKEVDNNLGSKELISLTEVVTDFVYKNHSSLKQDKKRKRKLSP